MSQIRKQIEDLVAALTDPIIVFDPSWADVLPDWLKAEVKLQRLAQLMKGEEGIATDAEAPAYVSNASLAVPLASDWMEIYGAGLLGFFRCRSAFPPFGVFRSCSDFLFGLFGVRTFQAG